MERNTLNYSCNTHCYHNSRYYTFFKNRCKIKGIYAGLFLKRECLLSDICFHLILRFCDYNRHVANLVPAKWCMFTLISSDQFLNVVCFNRNIKTAKVISVYKSDETYLYVNSRFKNSPAYIPFILQHISMFPISQRTNIDSHLRFNHHQELHLYSSPDGAARRLSQTWQSVASSSQYILSAIFLIQVASLNPMRTLFVPFQSIRPSCLSARSVIADLCCTFVDHLPLSQVIRLIVIVLTYFLCSSSLVPNVRPVSPIALIYRYLELHFS